MTHIYNITGMTCGNCVAKAKSQLLMLGDITEADVKLTAPQATITMQKHIPVERLQDALMKAGSYSITEADAVTHHTLDTSDSRTWFETYKPILLIGAYIVGLTLLVEAVRGTFNFQQWMHNFMVGFFLVFSFFKLLNLKGFADSYSTYDIVAKRWFSWGYVYPFIELGLGVAYLANVEPLIPHIITFVVMSLSIVGVLQSVLNKKKIQCACLGAVFNLPMSTVTIIEDALMIVMSGIMLFHILFNH